METNSEKPAGRNGLQGYFIALILILAGAMLLGQNMGYISENITHVVISWQMLLIVLGIASLFRGKFVGGLVLLLVGVYFLLPKLGWIDYYPIRTYWPVLLIILGIILIFRPKRGKKNWEAEFSRNEEVKGSDGYVISDAILGGVKQVVLDPVFKGAKLRTTFGGVVIDLRRTSLENDVTVIYTYCTFGGVELFVPDSWNVVNESEVIFGGFEDKRLQGIEKDLKHRVIIRGNITFGGVEIKN